MEHINPKVIYLYFIKNFITTVYIVPIWFLGVSIFEKIWVDETAIIPTEQIILILYGAGIIFFFLILISTYYWAVLYVANFTYELQNDGLHIRRGVIIRRHIIIPYAAIENIEQYVNPFVVRFMGLYGLHIRTRELTNTAGIFRKAHGELIPGLTQEKVQYLRNELIKLSHVQSVHKTFFDPISGKYS
ncbi:MAG: PH domain-containing protein [Candidatus Levybacteria bacterium]|nr:PH domain-containing protein [Candidatus Levybacteria bacterium]